MTRASAPRTCGTPGHTAAARPGSPGSCSSASRSWPPSSSSGWWAASTGRRSGTRSPCSPGGSPSCCSPSCVVRQVLNALPLALYIRGVSTYRATINDLGAILMSVVAPPPSDLALRVTMFTSWGVLGREGRGRHRDEHPDLLHRALLRAGARVRAAAGHRSAARPALARARQHRGGGRRSWSGSGWCCAARRWPGPSAPARAGSSDGYAATVDPDAWAEACLTFRVRHLRHLPARLPPFAGRADRDARRRRPGPAAVPALRRHLPLGRRPRSTSPSPTSSPTPSRSSRSRASASSTR